MMPLPDCPAPQPGQPRTPPPGRITLWQAAPDSPDAGKWLALMRYNGLQSCMVRDTREQALTDMTAFWAEHTAEGKS